MTATERIDYLADNEDGVTWFARAGITRRRARRELANLISEPLRRITARPVFMRPAEPGDDDDGHGQYVDEGWWFECDADYPAAVPAWRCEQRWQRFTAVDRWRAKAWRIYRGRRRPPMLWGGRVQRKANRLERLAFGRNYAVTIPGDRQLCLREREWRWCDTCQATTPHSLKCAIYPNNRELCLAERHPGLAVIARVEAAR